MGQILPLIAFPLLSFLTVLVGVPVARRVALRFGYVDKPGGRKNHDSPTPPIGGLVIIPTFIFLSLVSGASWATQWPFWLALCVIALAGALDDRYAIRPRWKFIAQFTAATIIVVCGGAKIVTLGDLFGFGPVWLGFMHIPFSVIAAVLLINAINLIDGLDGLAGGKSFVALFWMAVPCAILGMWVPFLSLALLMMAVLGFLIYNMRHPFRERATVFLGDAGSMSLGLALAWYGMSLSHSGIIEPIAVAWILALPIMDTCAQFARRVAQGRHPFDADRNHFHHHFINAGVDVGNAAGVITAIGFLLGLIGVGGMFLGVPEPVLAYLWIATLFAHIYMSLRPHRFRRIVSAIIRK
jgi:UDP-GlcNAc:undecaprenyl-phosphate GlcNAc-1-phosphate transferase